MAEVGPGPAGGSNRPALTDADGAARSLFRRWCEDSGFTVSVDQIGSIFATKPGTDNHLPEVCIGSHLDTQPYGGRYDGVLGVLAGLEVLRTLSDHSIETVRPITVANFTNEEGARFSPIMLGSGVFAGVHGLEWAHSITDADGRRVDQELTRLGWMGSEPPGDRKLRSYFELHIEQGPILEANECPIGVVTRVQGLRWLKISVAGGESHAGATPMDMRADAGLGMARIAQAIHEVASRFAPPGVATVGRCSLFPNTINTVPGRAEFTVDIRHPSREALCEMRDAICKCATEHAGASGLSISIEEIGDVDPVEFDESCRALLRQAARKLGYSHVDIVSGAAHDACWISTVAPAAMVMCPCIGGISHNEAEEIHPEWASAGANVLLHAATTSARPLT